MNSEKFSIKSLTSWAKKIWIMNLLLLATYVLIQTPGHVWLMSISQGVQAKPFNGAMMPLAFVPDWRKSDYIDQRWTLDYSAVKQADLIPLPRIEDLKTDFNSMFTYITMFRGKYMDENRVPGAGSHDGVDIRAPIGTPVFSIANGKVVKAHDDPNDKYITVEHRDVKYGGKVGKYYSSYLHLSAILVQPGEVIDKWTMIWRVGMTGMTTTPHLHIQVDNEDAPFYPYWPFDESQASDAHLNMFDAVDAGLNQDLISKYSVDPLDFIKNATTIDGQSVLGETTTPTPVQNKPVTTPKPLIQTTPTPTATPVPTITPPSNPGSFWDLGITNPYYGSITYFVQKWVVKWYNNGTFGPDKEVTRAELLTILLKTLSITPSPTATSGFHDVTRWTSLDNLVGEALKRKIITGSASNFRPNAPITRAEFLNMLVRATGEKTQSGVTKTWTDVKWSDWSYKYAVFAYQNTLFNDVSSDKFRPNVALSRGEALEAMYRYLRAKSKL